MGKWVTSLSPFDFLWVLPKTLHEGYPGSCGSSPESYTGSGFSELQNCCAAGPVVLSSPEDNPER